ncbi:MAG: cobalt-precorrin-5B (C(1))-methyltransferase [Bermanella sp.]
MWPESEEKPKKLRSGLTTGCCATACTVLAATVLLSKKDIEKNTANATSLVSVKLPKGKLVQLQVSHVPFGSQCVKASTIKDAGDDPDVTHGAIVFVQLTLSSNAGIVFKAASGVGTVTRDGLLLAVGEPAINPVPRKMISEHLLEIAQEHGYQGGFIVAVGVKGGEALALKTMNPRLGIVGGLSVLGTTGIVRPFSCAAYIASIHQGIDVAKANGFNHIAASTGNSSETAIRNIYQLPEMALIEMGDFVGAVLKYFKKVSVNKLSICGGFGKLSKLSQGHLDLHSGASSIDFNFLASLAKQQGAEPELLEKIVNANTSVQALKFCQECEIDLAVLVCQKALDVAKKIVPSHVDVEIWAVDRKGVVVGKAWSNDNSNEQAS